MILDPKGGEVDWIRGYAPPADKFMERIQRSLQGIDTYRALADLYARDPKNVGVVFKLARKIDEKGGDSKKADDLYRQVIALDPEGQAGRTEADYPKVEVPYTEYAEFILARKVSLGVKADPGPMRAFIAKYPRSPLIKTAYSYMSIYYGNYASPEEAAKFFEDYVTKYPDDAYVLDSYVRRIIKDKGPLDRGLELADKIAQQGYYDLDPWLIQNRAELLWLKGDKDKVEETFGKRFLDDRRLTIAYELASYANFWSDRDAHMDQAVGAVELAIQIEPALPYLRQTAATIYTKAGRPEKALEVFGPGFINKNLDKTDALYAYAWYWNGEGKNLESALEAIDRMIAIQPGLTYSDIRAQILLKLKRYDEALKSAEQALALAKESAKRNPAFATKTYEARVKEIKDAMGKEKK